MTCESKTFIWLSEKDKSRGLIIPNKITFELAYLCGVLAGDGSINFRKNKNEYSIKCVGNPKDEKPFYTDVIKPLFKKVFGIEINIKYLDSGTTFGFVLYSKSLVIFLTKTMNLPLGKKYNSLKIPKLFLSDEKLIKYFVKGVFDTDGCICFKKKYHDKPYYPVISLSSKSKLFVREIVSFLKNSGFKIYESYNYHVKDNRLDSGFTIINRIELNGIDNLNKWIEVIGFSSPKHIEKIKKYRKD